MSETFAVIAGGGTAGHVNPGLALAAELVARGHGADTIIWVGSERGLEVTLVPPTGHPLHVLPGRGLQRRITLANVGALWGLFVAAARAFGLVRRLRPRVVVALGGYASVPCAFAAWVCRVPIVVMEQNKRPGLANRLSARVAKAVAVSFEGTPLPHAVVTGNPLRKEVLDVDRAKVRAATPATVIRARHWWLVGRSAHQRRCARARPALGGACRSRRPSCRRPSQHRGGARGCALASDRRPAVRDRRLRGRHADRDGSRRRRRLPRELGLVSEVAVIGVPSVLVPWSGAAEDHQTANASVLLDVGAAEVITDAEVSGARLQSALESLLADPARLDSMARACKEVARPDAAQRVADLVEEQARG